MFSSQLQGRCLSSATALSLHMHVVTEFFICTSLTLSLLLPRCGCQLWPGDSQSASRAPVPSCLAGQIPRYTGGWPRGGKRWAGSRRTCWICRPSGQTWACSQSDGSGSQVSHAWPGLRVNKGQGLSLCW